MLAHTPAPQSKALPSITVSLAAALAAESELAQCVTRAARTLSSTRVARPARARAKLLPEGGSIDLPDSAPGPYDGGRIAIAGPLYMVHELQHAGLLRAAEQVAGLFASGAITQDLGASAAVLNEFWRTRQTRLGDAERTQLLEQAFEDRYFYGLMRGLCDALVALSDNGGVPDLREQVGLEMAVAQITNFLLQRTQGMIVFAAQDLVDNINTALSFLRDRVLQTAFGAHDLWELVEICARSAGDDTGEIREHVDMARSGAEVLNWLAQAGPRPQTSSSAAEAIAGAAVRWLSAFQGAQHMPAAPGLT
jgi:hypothetical protein